jgi:hypothetical protein
MPDIDDAPPIGNPANWQSIGEVASDLFGEPPAPTDPLIGKVVELQDGAYRCHLGLAFIEPGKGPHAYGLRCTKCEKHVGWLPIMGAEMVRKIIDLYAGPLGTEQSPIMYRVPFPQPQETEMSDRKFDNNNSGALFKNNDKGGDKDPDYRGSINAAGLDYWVSAWIKKSKKGVTYMSLSLKLKDGEAATSKQGAPVDLGDSVPFAPEVRG